ncbi:hypothetical protein C8R28_10538 [Nitrosomonas ureae]|uniref:Uncharacterized protein n=1 Tax=Nitrosomonas ureae TaxID=44577 RepID=A0A2T5I615_9PROT|nr:hypothetical protein C8R28_10538 [Nitrosomonas ureae]
MDCKKMKILVKIIGVVECLQLGTVWDLLGDTIHEIFIEGLLGE